MVRNLSRKPLKEKATLAPGPWPHGQEPEGRRRQGQGVPTAAAGAGPHGHRGSTAQEQAAALLPKPVHWVCN